MSKWIRYLVAGVGLPLVAQQFHDQTQHITDKLKLVTFLTSKKKEVARIGMTGLSGMIFSICGLALTAFSIAQHYDLQLDRAIGATTIVSLVILAIGLSLCAYAWRTLLRLEKEFEILTIEAPQHSLLKTILSSALYNFFGIPPGTFDQQRTYHS